MKHPVEILQDLIRIDTTNPPGNETAVARYLAELLEKAGIATKFLGDDEQRLNLIARLPGRGEAPPVLWQGHMDVVTTAGQHWSHPPLAAEIHDEMLWGRGTLDDKGSLAIMVAALLKAKETGVQPPGDIVLTAVADEEVDGSHGARFLVEKHPEEFKGIRYGIGEGGGCAVWISGQKFYPIMVVEKQVCTLKATFRGKAGHGATPLRNGAMVKMARALTTLNRKRLPVHITPVGRAMLEGMSKAFPFPKNIIFQQLLNPALTDRILDALGDALDQVNPVLHNTVSPTIVEGSGKINVIPETVQLGMDGRMLPGFKPETMRQELSDLLGPEAELEVVRYDPGPPPPTMTRYEILAQALKAADPSGYPIPYQLSAVTDGRYFCRLGIEMYGFMPLDLPPDLINTVHGGDERVPVASIEKGAAIMFDILKKF